MNGSSGGSTAGRTLFLAIAAVACIAGYVYVYASGRETAPIRSDAFSYYVYLPSWALYHDLSLQAVADDCCGGTFPEWSAITRWPRTHRWVDAHPIGEAVLIAPFFAVAHLLTKWTNLPPNGFSFYYQHAAGLAGLSYVLVGLWFLHRLLSRYFTSGIVVAALATLLAGTSLYHYATYDSAWSHAFSFALCSALFERLDAWNPPRRSNDVAIGLIAGLLFLVRHTNIAIPICLLAAMWLPGAVPGDARSKRRLTITAAVTAAIVIAPQLWLYKLSTRHWLVSAYGTLGFTFTDPHFWGVLFSPRKGLFFYAPVLLLALGGLAILPQGLSRWRLPTLVILTVHTYLIACWWDWQFGGSYGHRGFVDIYPLLAPGMAAVFARITARPVMRGVVGAAVVLLCALSIFQMLQYWHGVLPISDVTWRQYRALFLRTW
ncbi:MAG TPA: hypothetical protein VEL79_18355 [Vicinamibacterales bacterium]|nr:hypothetical protein [Vicinamibacterales bacterium]